MFWGLFNKACRRSDEPRPQNINAEIQVAVNRLDAYYNSLLYEGNAGGARQDSQRWRRGPH